MRLPTFAVACVAIFVIRMESAVHAFVKVCKGYAEDPRFHRFVGNASTCKSSDPFFEEWTQSSDFNRCSPKDVQVELKSRDGIYTPSFVTVKRCIGHCGMGKYCHVAEKDVTEKFFAVRRTLISGKSDECGMVLVEEHNSCMCDCKKSDMRCSVYQKEDRHRCRCACNASMEKYRKHCENARHTWDNDNCRCLCQPQSCKEGLTWAPLLCKCVSIDQ